MKFFFRTLTALLMALFFSGCMEEAVLLKVNKDGSGQVIVREMVSSQMGQMMGGEGIALQEVPDAAAQKKAEAEKKASAMGEGVAPC